MPDPWELDERSQALATEKIPSSNAGAPPQGLAGRVIAVVEAVVDAGAPVGPRGLARTAGIDRSAVGRILQQLRELGVLERLDDGYVPGPRLFAIGRMLAALDTLPNAARSVLHGLVSRFNETCYVCMRHGDSVVFLYEAQSTNPVRYVVEIGKPAPLHAGAAGRAILAGIPRQVAAEVLGKGPLPAITPNTIRDVRKLLDVAEADRRRGYSISIEERFPGGSAIAAPFYDHTAECRGSVVFTCPLQRLDRDRLDEFGEAVRDAANALSARLGFHADDLPATVSTSTRRRSPFPS